MERDDLILKAMNNGKPFQLLNKTRGKKKQKGENCIGGGPKNDFVTSSKVLQEKKIWGKLKSRNWD